MNGVQEKPATATPRDPSLPNEDFWERQKAKDEENVSQILNLDSDFFASAENQNLLDADREYDQAGKADDAEDFADISDDDLPDDEEPDGDLGDSTEQAAADFPGLTDDGGTSNDLDDLWGEGDVRESSPLDVGAPSSPPRKTQAEEDAADAVDDAAGSTRAVEDHDDANDPVPGPTDFELNFPQFDFSLNQDPNIPAVAQTELELVKAVWPTFDTGTYFDWNRLLPPKKATWVGKKPGRHPKPLVPTKLSLDLDVDQEKLFRIPGPASGTARQKIHDAELRGLVSCLVPEPVAAEDIAIFQKDLEDDSEVVAGFTLADFETICYDFESMIEEAQPISPPPTPQDVDAEGDDADEDAGWDRMFRMHEPPAKKRKVIVEKGLPRIPRFEAPNFDQFAEATSRAAKRVHLDLADPFLLIEEQTTKRRKLNHPTRMTNGRLGSDVKSRFNFSNDEAYEQLKLNHKHKVRATIGNVAVEHSVPATKLLWPYYLVRPHGIDPYEFHRPTLQTSKGAGVNVKFIQPATLKRKEKRLQKLQEAFATSKDLSLNDNSTAVLFEYCEQIPTVLSNYGMGNKIVNHTRRKGQEDENHTIDKNKYELGEPNILLLEDKSPFSIFGQIAPGEVVPALQNPMFQAPIFKHKPRRTDFLCGRTTTGLGGSNYYLRKIDHMYVVGQNFPTAEVPGPHSRKVTSLSKNRLKMISYRLIHNRQSVTLGDITSHVKDSNDAQNRQKLKEFLSYNKETKSWGLPPGEKLMDHDMINAMIKPEDVCLLDAMQVGQNELILNGYNIDDTALAENDDNDAANDKESFAAAMVPWKTTKAFIDACAGKAMVRLRGPGDPTGHGLGFSFIKTSMKGGYMEAIRDERGPGTTAADTIDAQLKDANGHSYNVKRQEELYNNEIAEIWAKQRATLSDPTEHGDEDLQPRGDEDDRLFAPASQIPPTPVNHHVDDKTSVYSRRSATDAGAGGKLMLRIYRKKLKPNGEEGEEEVEMVVDSGVINRYIKVKSVTHPDIDLFSGNIEFTGVPEQDKAILEQINAEEARLVRNQERRLQREKSKAANVRMATPLDRDRDPDSPAPSIEKGAGGGGGGVGGTTRKCANCGQKGHIKTNKKLCPMLNGTWKNESNGLEAAGGFGDVSNA